MENDNEVAPAPEGVVTLIDSERMIYLVGVVHGSRASVRRVAKVIADLRPKTVCIELCAEHNMLDGKFWSNLDPRLMLRSGNILFWLVNLAGHASMVRTKRQGIPTANASMQAGLEAAASSRVVFVDRHPHVTFARAWDYGSTSERLALVWSVWPWLVGHDEPHDAEAVEELEDEVELRAAHAEADELLPGTMRAVIHERADYVAHMLKKTKGDVVAVVSKGLVEGIVARFTTPIVAAKLTKAPVIGKTWTVLRWLVAMLGWWLLWDNGGSGLGTRLSVWAVVTSAAGVTSAVFAGGHGFTVLTTVVVTPLTTLLPIQRAGVVAARIERRSREPTAADRLSLQQDSLQNAEFRASPLVRPLLVALSVDAGALLSAIMAVIWLLAA